MVWVGSTIWTVPEWLVGFLLRSFSLSQTSNPLHFVWQIRFIPLSCDQYSIRFQIFLYAHCQRLHFHTHTHSYTIGWEAITTATLEGEKTRSTSHTTHALHCSVQAAERTDHAHTVVCLLACAFFLLPITFRPLTSLESTKSLLLFFTAEHH